MIPNSGFRFRLVLISGPPRTGKNRAGICLAEWLDGDHFALSNQLKRMTHAHYGLGSDLPPLHFEDIKDLPAPHFGGLSARQAYISFSEDIMKPRHGSGFLGEIAGKRITDNCRQNRISIVSGVGFADEVAPLVAAAGAAKSLHVRLRTAARADRHGDDSREILDLEPLGVLTVELPGQDCRQLIRDLSPAIETRQLR